MWLILKKSKLNSTHQCVRNLEAEQGEGGKRSLGGGLNEYKDERRLVWWVRVCGEKEKMDLIVRVKLRGEIMNLNFCRE